ncbi:MAG: hypothetical protein WB988_26220 [Candidatus Nitrosopolaris sp.]|jgi:hypothetical protein
MELIDELLNELPEMLAAAQLNDIEGLSLPIGPYKQIKQNRGDLNSENILKKFCLHF